MALFDYYNTGDTAWARIQGANLVAQTFIASSSYTLESVKVLIYRVGSPGTATLEIWTTVAGTPTTLIISESFNGNDLTTDTAGEWKEITYNPTTDVTNGTQYAIVLSAPSGNLSNAVWWRMDGTSPAYTGGGTWAYSSGIWTDYTGLYDSMFETYGTASGPAYVNLTGTLSGTGSIAGTLYVPYIVNVTGTLSGTGGIVGTLGFATVVPITGTLIGTGSLSGTLTVIGGKPVDKYTHKHLVVVGSDAVWYL